MLNNLPEIDFVDKDANKIESSIITMYQAISGRTLAKGDPVRLFLEAMAVIIIQQRVLIDYSAKQNLLAYAEGDKLDHIGVLVGVIRLASFAALTTLRFTLSVVQDEVITIPAGIRATTASGIVFEVSNATEIPAGKLYADAPAICADTGVIGNAYEPGQINKIVDPLPWVQSVSNTTTSEGGVDTESDDKLRERIRQAPEGFSTAGPGGAYEYWAKTAHQSIIDVAVYSPVPGEVELRPLLTGGQIPGAEILDAVNNVCNDKKIRPLTDKVTVLSPELINYTITLTYHIAREDSTRSLAIQQAVNQAVDDYIVWQKSKLGRDINPSELIWRVRAAGASRVEVTAPVYVDVYTYQVAVVDSVTVNFGGLNDG